MHSTSDTHALFSQNNCWESKERTGMEFMAKRTPETMQDKKVPNEHRWTTDIKNFLNMVRKKWQTAQAQVDTWRSSRTSQPRMHPSAVTSNSLENRMLTYHEPVKFLFKDRRALYPPSPTKCRQWFASPAVSWKIHDDKVSNRYYRTGRDSNIIVCTSS